MLEKLRLFLVVLEEGSLRRAADRLRISQSALTRQMQSLELDLGGRVLERTSAGVRPTNGGHALVERAKTLLADYDSTMAEIRRLNLRRPPSSILAGSGRTGMDARWMRASVPFLVFMRRAVDRKSVV